MSDQLDRLRAALADHYAIEREIGSGGMATVYLARDLKHDRQVAIKVLRPDLAATLGPERFHREIKIAAQLQHPHILPLLDSGEAEDPTPQPPDRQTGSSTAFLYYVMPYIEGQSLREKLAKEGELPIGEAVRILRDVADALTEAHAHGVVHRDIKPENILLRGRHALVTDFGVAKAVSEATGREKLTTAGVALGTPAYMAPEQAAADPHLDHRVDIYALGAVAYELLTGRPVFMGTTPQMVLSAHMTEAPDPVTKHRDTVPAALEAIVMRCLEKKPADRWRYAEDLLPQFEALTTPSGGMTPTDTAPMKAAHWSAATLVRVAAIAVAVMAIVVGALWLTRGSPQQRLQPGRQTQLTFDPGLELDPAISPDGNWIAYVAGPIGDKHVYVRPVAGGRAVDVSEGLPGDHSWPQWSPDGTEILFAALEGLYVVPPTGGAIRRIVERSPNGACWSPDGLRIAYPFGRDSIKMVTVDGGEPERVTEDLEPHSCKWSPDGSRLVYVSGNPAYVFGGNILGNRASSAIRVLSIAEGRTITLSDEPGAYQSPVWLPSGDGILYVSNVGGSRDIYEVPVDASGEAAGSATRLTTGADALTMSLSADGQKLTYSQFRYDANIWSIDIPEAGTASASEANPVTEGAQAIEGIGVSPDRQWLAFDSDRRGNADIYRLMLPDGEPELLTDDPTDDMIPSWSPDGQEIVFYSFRHGNRDVFVMNADGGNEQRVTDDPAQERYPAWSPDGNSIVFQSDKTGRQEVWVVSRENRSSDWGTPRQLTSDGGGYPRWSPDGEWVAYTGQGAVRIISPGGGEPQSLADLREYRRSATEWSSDGRTIYLKAIDANGRAGFWAVPLEGGEPRLLVRFDDPDMRSNRGEFATDGERFYFTIGRQESDIWMMELLNVER